MVDLTEKYVGKVWRDAAGQLMSPNLAFLMNEIDNYNIFVLQGGARSTKTYSVLMFIIANIANHSNIFANVVRQSMPILKGTVIPDFVEIATKAGVYKKSNHNQTDQIYRHNSNQVRFVAAEDEEKLRGRKGNLLYINEAPEVSFRAANALMIRNEGKTIFDYNPSYPESWMYDEILPRKNVAFIRTTYKDNPFMSKSQLEEMEHMRLHHPEEYKVFGMGLRGEGKGQIYSNFRKIRDDQFPSDADVWLLDFGFSSDPACLMRTKFVGRTIYANEILYDTDQKNLDLLIHLFFAGYDENKGHILIADSSDPQNIAEMRYGLELDDEYLIDRVASLGYGIYSPGRFRKLKDMISGINILGAIKGPGSIRAGIKKVQSYEVLLTESSTNTWLEYPNYRYKIDRFTGRPTREPVDKDNHAMDCLRYGALAEGRYHFAQKEG